MTETSEARERILDAAEQLFMSRGYNAVTLRDIGAVVGIRHTSLYHHFPKGKEQLFIEVIERDCRRHQAGLATAFAQASGGVRPHLYAMADWYCAQPPLDIVRLMQLDMAAIDPAQAQRLSQLLLDSLIEPIVTVLLDGQADGEIAHPDLGLIAGGLFGMIESLFAIPEHAVPQGRALLAHTFIDVVLAGLQPSQSSPAP